MGETLTSLLAGGAPSFSFEFFPPADQAAEDRLWEAIRALERLRPTFISVTYGAGGSTRDRTVRITREIAQHTALTTVAHLTCVGSSRDELRATAGEYMAAGINNVLALRGDPPGGPQAPWVTHPDGLDHADELVELLTSVGDFSVGVAAFPDGHPASGGNMQQDIDVLIRKCDLGAQFAITQFFFDVDAWVRLVEALQTRGCSMPVIPGVMPVTNIKQLQRFADLNGTPLPASMLAQFERIADDPVAVRALGVDIAANLSQGLLDAGAPGIHFFTLNASTATREVYQLLTGADA